MLLSFTTFTICSLWILDVLGSPLPSQKTPSLFPKIKVLMEMGQTIVIRDFSGVLHRADKKNLEEQLVVDSINFNIYSNVKYEDDLSCWITLESPFHTSHTGKTLSTTERIALARCDNSECIRGVGTAFNNGRHNKNFDFEKMYGTMRFQIHCRDNHISKSFQDIRIEFNMNLALRNYDFEKQRKLKVNANCTSAYEKPLFRAQVWDGIEPTFKTIKGEKRIFTTLHGETFCELGEVSLRIKEFPAPKYVPISNLPFISKLDLGPFDFIPKFDLKGKQLAPTYRLNLHTPTIVFKLSVQKDFSGDLNCEAYGEPDFETRSEKSDILSEYKEPLFLFDCKGSECLDQRLIMLSLNNLSPWKTLKQFDRMLMFFHIRCIDLKSNSNFEYTVNINIHSQFNGSLWEEKDIASYQEKFTGLISDNYSIPSFAVKTGPNGVKETGVFSYVKKCTDSIFPVCKFIPYRLLNTQYRFLKKENIE